MSEYRVRYDSLIGKWVVIHYLYDDDGDYTELEIDKFNNLDSAREYKEKLEKGNGM